MLDRHGTSARGSGRTSGSGWTKRQKWEVLLSCGGVALVIAAMAAPYAALPQLTVATGATQAQLTWIVDGYTLALACGVLPAGGLGDRFGRRRVLLIGLIVFAAASLLSIWTLDSGMLVGLRVLAGLGAALVMPSTLSALTDGMPAGKYSLAVGLWAGVAGTGGLFGMVGSGVLVEYCDWRMIFVAFVVSAALLFVLYLATIPPQRVAGVKWDAAGSLTSATAIAALVFALIEGPLRGWTDPVVLVPAAVGSAGITAFVLVELRTKNPLLPMKLFASRGFSSGALSIAIQFMACFAAILLTFQYLQLMLGDSPLQAGLALAPIPIPLILGSLLTPWLTRTFTLRQLIVTGQLLIAVGFFAFGAVSAGADHLYLLLPQLIMTTGYGLATAPSTWAIMRDAPAGKHGVAAAVNDVSREFGAAIGIAVAGSVLAAQYVRSVATQLPSVADELRAPVSKSLATTLATAPRTDAGSYATKVASDAFAQGVTAAAVTMGTLVLVGAVVLAALTPGVRAVDAAPRPNHPTEL
ncbi:MFS transporter [Nocardia colli]|uniref:MFS transporter n=1 Tax=Nocardia colli TaxID=2545717 RepID=UPI0035D9FC72